MIQPDQTKSDRRGMRAANPIVRHCDCKEPRFDHHRTVLGGHDFVYLAWCCGCRRPSESEHQRYITNLDALTHAVMLRLNDILAPYDSELEKPKHEAAEHFAKVALCEGVPGPTIVKMMRESIAKHGGITLGARGTDNEWYRCLSHWVWGTPWSPWLTRQGASTLFEMDGVEVQGIAIPEPLPEPDGSEHPEVGPVGISYQGAETLVLPVLSSTKALREAIAKHQREVADPKVVVVVGTAGQIATLENEVLAPARRWDNHEAAMDAAKRLWTTTEMGPVEACDAVVEEMQRHPEGQRHAPAGWGFVTNVENSTVDIYPFPFPDGAVKAWACRMLCKDKARARKAVRRAVGTRKPVFGSETLERCFRRGELMNGLPTFTGIDLGMSEGSETVLVTVAVLSSGERHVVDIRSAHGPMLDVLRTITAVQREYASAMFVVRNGLGSMLGSSATSVTFRDGAVNDLAEEMAAGRWAFRRTLYCRNAKYQAGADRFMNECQRYDETKEVGDVMRAALVCREGIGRLPAEKPVRVKEFVNNFNIHIDETDEVLVGESSGPLTREKLRDAVTIERERASAPFRLSPAYAHAPGSLDAFPVGQAPSDRMPSFMGTAPVKLPPSEEMLRLASMTTDDLMKESMIANMRYILPNGWRP